MRGGHREKEACEVSCGRARAFTSAAPFCRRLPGSVPVSLPGGAGRS